MQRKLKTLDMTYIAMCAVIIAICSWISIPATVPFTLQTFAVFLTVTLLGGKRGTIAVVLYILLGAVGIPVFQGFSGGIGVILGNTGGYIIGFIFSALIMWAVECFLGKKLWMQALSMVLGLIACYTVGTIWFMTVYNSGADEKAGLALVLGWCVIPFIIPDAIKIVFALVLGKQLKKAIRIEE